ncbi:MAG: hypothetical protein ABID38_01745 [Candidatus Diapherotrites archaeon]
MAKTETSIIEIIQKMVSEGADEQEIIHSLTDLGVEPAKAKRLLLLGQADTFALLKNEISKIVTEDLGKEKINLQKFIETEARSQAMKSKDLIESAIMEDVKKYERDITGQSQTFQDQINDTVRRVAELSDRVRGKLNELGEAVGQTQADMDEVKLKGIGQRNKIASYTLLVLGLAFCLLDFYFFFTTFSGEIAIDSVIMMVLVAFIGVTFLFVATVI